MVKFLSESSGAHRKFLFFSAILICLLGALVYANSLTGQFVWDDETLIQYNPYIKSWAHLPTIFTTRLGGVSKEAGAFYRPVQIFSYLLDYSVWRLHVVGYHMVNLAWHLLAALGVFGLVQTLFKNGKLSLVTALLFVVHPVHTEAVSYISGRADSLAAFFMMLSFILYLKHVQRPRGAVLAGIAVSYLLALLSKELSLVLPFLILFFHFSMRTSIDKKALTAVLATFAGYAFWRFWVIKTGAIAEGAVPTFWERLPGVFVALANYARILGWPFDLHMEYGGILFTFSEPKAAVGIALSLILILTMVLRREKDRFLFFAIGWFWICLLPSSNLFYPINAYMAEHWLYLPSIGIFLIVARLFVGLWENPKFRTFAGIGIVSVLVFFAVMTVRQNRYWHNGISFYQHMLRYAPESSRLYNNLAKAFHDAGKNDELIALLKSAIQLQPDNALAYNNLGNAYKGIGKFKEAVGAYEQAVRIDPRHAGPYYNLSTIYADVEGRQDEAVALLKKAIELSPHFSKAYNKLGLIYLARGQKEEAIGLLNKAMALNPDDPEVYHNFGYIYIQMDDADKAVQMYEKALKADPNYAAAYHDLAVIYFSKKDYARAVAYCDKAVGLGYADPALLEAVGPFR